jgi:hypothetical protein
MKSRNGTPSPISSAIRTAPQKNLPSRKSIAGQGAGCSSPNKFFPTRQTSAAQQKPHPLQGEPFTGFSGAVCMGSESIPHYTHQRQICKNFLEQYHRSGAFAPFLNVWEQFPDTLTPCIVSHFCSVVLVNKT